MKQEINPKDTRRAQAFEQWMKSPMPMVTLTKTFDVTRLRKLSRRRGLNFKKQLPFVTNLCRLSHKFGSIIINIKLCIIKHKF